MFQLILFLHILGAIAAFGFGFYAPIFGMMLANEPQHGNWYLRSAKRVSSIVIIPVAISLFITGTLLVVETGGMSRFQEPWLAVSLILYFIAIGIAIILQRPALSRVIELTSQPPGPEGPPAGVAENVKKLQLYGTILLVIVITILALMVWKPGL